MILICYNFWEAASCWIMYDVRCVMYDVFVCNTIYIQYKRKKEKHRDN